MYSVSQPITPPTLRPYQKQVIVTLDIRSWDCPNCGTHHDRDINAARNIRDEGLRIISSGTGDKAYCPDVRPNSKGRKPSTIRHFVG